MMESDFPTIEKVDFANQQEIDDYNMMSMYPQNDDPDQIEILPYNAANSYMHMEDSDSENRNIASFSVEEYIGDLQSKASAPRPQSAPAGRRGLLQGEVVSETFTPYNEGANLKSPSRLTTQFFEDDVHIAETVKLPSSPYDEEVEFEYLPEDDEDLDSAYLDSRRGSSATGAYLSSTGTAAVDEEHWVEENRRYLMASTEADIPAAPVLKQSGLRPRPSSADPRLRQGGAHNASTRSSSAGRFGTSFNSTAFATRQGRYSLPDPFSSNNFAKQRSSSTDRAKLRVSHARNSTEKLSAMKDLVEDLVRNTAKKADLYHMIQVRQPFASFIYLLIFCCSNRFVI